MNKSQLVDALAERLGDRRTAATAVEGLLETIVDTVRSGDSVSITGFGVFEARARAARTARNPRTGASVAVPATTVPAFRPGTSFRSAVGGSAVGGSAVSGSAVSGSAVSGSAVGVSAVETAPDSSSPTPRATKGAASFAAPLAAPEAPAKPEKSSKKGKGKDKAGKSGDKGKKAKSKK
jgi:DNA-binding protein HU-beta